jgi:hypothetical protein
VDDADADRLNEGEFAVMERGWQKLPYPKFLEKVQASLWSGGVKLWCGRCIFSFLSRARVHSDGRHRDISAVATMSEDLTEIAGRLQEAGMEFRGLVKIGGTAVVKAFDVVEAQPGHNPDGSFHHITLRLRERGGEADGTAAVCEESGCAEADFEKGAGGVGADCP